MEAVVFICVFLDFILKKSKIQTRSESQKFNFSEKRMNLSQQQQQQKIIIQIKKNNLRNKSLIKS